MGRSHVVVALGLACCALSLVEFEPSFVQAVSRSAPPSSLGGDAALQGLPSAPQAQRGWAATGLPAAAAVLVLGALGASTQRMKHTRASRTQAKVTLKKGYINYGDVGDGIDRMSSVSVYARALLDIASQKKESVPVTKDVMKIKRILKDDEFQATTLFLLKQDSLNEVDEARKLVKIFDDIEPFESTIVPKFIVFLAKKRRLDALTLIAADYIFLMFSDQSIAPVVVTSAERLSDEQKEMLMEKMKSKTGTADIKLVNHVDPSLIAGFSIEWAFTDPEDPKSALNKLDLSMAAVLKKSALDQGVVVAESIY